MTDQLTINIQQTSDYKFEVDFGAALSPMMADLPPHLGEGSAPSPEHLLLAAVANCLSASLLFALRKFKQNADNIRCSISCTVDRNEQKRLRVTQINADINLGKAAAEFEHLERILAQFEDFCTVSQSVQAGIPLQINVLDGDGMVLK